MPPNSSDRYMVTRANAEPLIVTMAATRTAIRHQQQTASDRKHTPGDNPQGKADHGAERDHDPSVPALQDR